MLPAYGDRSNAVGLRTDATTRQRTGTTRYTRVPHLEKCLREYLESYNENPHTLVWKKTVDEIVEKIRWGRTVLSKTLEMLFY